MSSPGVMYVATELDMISVVFLPTRHAPKITPDIERQTCACCSCLPVDLEHLRGAKVTSNKSAASPLLMAAGWAAGWAAVAVF